MIGTPYCLVRSALHLHFDEVAVLKALALVDEGREVAHDAVDGEAGREGDASLQILALLVGESLLDLLFDEAVAGGADGRDVGAGHGKLDGLFEAR